MTVPRARDSDAALVLKAILLWAAAPLIAAAAIAKDLAEEAWDLYRPRRHG